MAVLDEIENATPPSSSTNSDEETSATGTTNPLTFQDPKDPANPKNWSLFRRLFITFIWIAGNLVASVSSSIFSSGAQAISEEFHVGTEVVTLGVSLFVIGYSVGPPFWSPLSEQFGRRYPMLAGMALFTIFCIPVAVGKNLQTILIGRFLCGVTGVAPIALFGGGLVDIWHPEQRAIAMATVIGIVLGGPLLAPVMGSFITASHLGWRWTGWLSCIMGGSCTVLVLFGLPETYPPAILQKRQREDLGRNGKRETGGWHRFVRVYLVRPFVLLGTEPILVLMTLYQAFAYGILYLVFSSYPIIFREQRHWKLGLSSLPFLGMMVGVFIGSAMIVTRTVLVQHATRRKQSKESESEESSTNPPVPAPPERRLPLMMAGSILLPVGLFIFGWTSALDIPWVGMIIGSLFVGSGLLCVFVTAMTYILDVYSHVANSALGANTIVRSLFAAGFPLFASYMYKGLGVAWASSVLGFVSIAMIPIPVIFYKYGPRIRALSKNLIV
ncbi:MFS general substrate transporter [Trichoderma citrinoviride]|uniref:MFS general substrate transporter n=1 Tax=Trichoderma citrinoviride TaxID=58853 RepID=A0A2T4BA20_9HYPO|nr:MFS general substrate transporter [Trichoderma citrinoviride]PTB66175.1 MFS general substrate transporter [Trichoderma citrinoviride]